MIKTFTVESSIEIASDKQIYDLHNWYCFAEMRITTRPNTVEFLFRRTDEKGRSPVGAEVVGIIFTNVDYFELSPSFAAAPSDQLEEIGYKNCDDFDLDWLLGETQSTSKDHMLFRFANDEYVRIHSELASFTRLAPAASSRI